MCINDICSAASQDSGAREVRTSAPGRSWGATGARQLSQPHTALSFIEILLVLDAAQASTGWVTALQILER